MQDIQGELLYQIMKVFGEADEDGSQLIDFEEFKVCMGKGSTDAR